MIIYIKQSDKIRLIHKILNILKKDKINDKDVLYLPINKNTRKKKIKKVIEKLNKYLYKNNIKDIVLEQELMKNEDIKNIIYENNINILDGTKVSKYLVYNLIQKIYSYTDKKIETGEITLLINDNDQINIENIAIIAQNIKRLNIITNHTKKFRKIVDYLYKELGLLIKLSNNIKTNLTNSDIIVNIDFPEEIINKLDIPNDAIILNIQQNININSKKFIGINIQSWQMEIPKKYELKGFEDIIMYEAQLYKKTLLKAFEMIQNDNIKIKNLIGINGVINTREFVQKIQNST